MGNNNQPADWKSQLAQLGKQLREEMTPEEYDNVIYSRTGEHEKAISFLERYIASRKEKNNENNVAKKQLENK